MGESRVTSHSNAKQIKIKVFALEPNIEVKFLLLLLVS